MRTGSVPWRLGEGTLADPDAGEALRQERDPHGGEAVRQTGAAHAQQERRGKRRNCKSRASVGRPPSVTCRPESDRLLSGLPLHGV